MSVRDQINNGDYKTKLPYPERVPKPLLMRKRVEDLNEGEIASIPQVTADFKATLAKWDVDYTQYRDDQNRLDRQFRDDVEAEFGMTGHPKADVLWSKARERGDGDTDGTLDAYEDLHELIA